LLPFRPNSPSLNRCKLFVQSHFSGGRPILSGESLIQELRWSDPLVLAATLRWIWARLEGGIVGWDCYRKFTQTEETIFTPIPSHYPPSWFSTMISVSAKSQGHVTVICDFFEFLLSVSSRFKTNGFSGTQLAHIAGWWVFDNKATRSDFSKGYAMWRK
jgi:Domain of unknown function (DUF1708)